MKKESRKSIPGRTGEAFARLLCLYSLSMALAAFGSAASTASAAEIDFLVAVQAPTGLAPHGVAVGDLDNDGDRDVVTADLDSQGAPAHVSVLLNLGGGRFAPPARYLVGENPQAVVIADFNRDGRPDLAVANELSDSVSVLTNAGNGAFLPARSYAAAWHAHDLVAADFTGDGVADLAVAGLIDTIVAILRNDGAGNFTRGPDVNVGASGTIDAADFDRDGRVDLIFADGASLGVKLIRNLGNATFAPYVLYRVSDGYLPDVAAGDFDRDGWPDVVALGRGLWLLRNNRDGTLATPVNFEMNQSSRLAVGDLDGDGFLDVAGSNYLGNSVSVVRNDGAGGFRARDNWGTGTNPWSVAVGDVTGDGRADLVAPNSQLSNTEITVLENLGAASFRARRDYPLLDAARGVAVADFNRDGLPDVATGVWIANLDRIAVLYGLPDGTLGPAMYSAHFGNNAPTNVAAGDFDRDGWPDLAATIFSPGNGVKVFINNRDGTFTGQPIFRTGGNPAALVATDLDRDGWLDLAVTNGARLDNTVSILLNNGDGTFFDGGRYPVGLSPRDIVAGDLDRDQDDDLIVSHIEASFIIVLRNNGSGTFTAQQYSAGNVQADLELADFDGDQWLDVAAGAGVLTLLRNDRAGGFGAPEPTGVPADTLTSGDFDGDGDPDVAAVRNVASTVTVATNTDGGLFQPGRRFVVGYLPGRAAAVDLDRDGQPDVIIANDRGQSISVLRNLTRLVGDVNCDRALNGLDLGGFVLAVLDPAAYRAAYPDCDIRNADINGDGVVNEQDIAPFVGRLLG